MQQTSDEPQVKCVVCQDPLPETRMSLACAGCGYALHPSCATRIERGDIWGDRRMLCPQCVAREAGQE